MPWICSRYGSIGLWSWVAYQITSAISLNDLNVKLDRFEAFGLRKIREQVNMCMGFSLTSWISDLAIQYYGIPWNSHLHNRTNITRWEKLWTFAMPNDLAKSQLVFRNCLATPEKVALKFLWVTSHIFHMKCIVQTFISSNACMQFGHKKVLGEVRGWIGILFENQSINVCRDSGSDWTCWPKAPPRSRNRLYV